MLQRKEWRRWRREGSPCGDRSGRTCRWSREGLVVGPSQNDGGVAAIERGLEASSRKYGVTAATLSRWREAFLEGGTRQSQEIDSKHIVLSLPIALPLRCPESVHCNCKPGPSYRPIVVRGLLMEKEYRRTAMFDKLDRIFNRDQNQALFGKARERSIKLHRRRRYGSLRA